jgi:lipopolysaccharide/colanic/teichoic acid biosynthesis glycosyltransferase
VITPGLTRIGSGGASVVLPGITCLWQVTGRSNIGFDRWMELDMQYIDDWSFWLDLKILLRTIPSVFKGVGAA